MAQATLVHGAPVMVDYTPGSAVTAGDVIVAEDAVFVAHNSIAASALGAVAAGGGVYQLSKATTSGSAIAFGDTVYWDDSNNQGTATASSHKKFGICVTDGGAGDSDSTVLVLHRPN